MHASSRGSEGRAWGLLRRFLSLPLDSQKPADVTAAQQQPEVLDAESAVLTQPRTWSAMQHEVPAIIFSHLDFRSKLSAVMTCREWRDVLLNSQVVTTWQLAAVRLTAARVTPCSVRLTVSDGEPLLQIPAFWGEVRIDLDAVMRKTSPQGQDGGQGTATLSLRVAAMVGCVEPAVPG